MEANLDFYQVARPDIKDLSISVVSKTETKEHIIKINSENTEDGEECGIEIICDSNKDLRNALLKLANTFDSLAKSIQNKAEVESTLNRACGSYIPEVDLILQSSMSDTMRNEASKGY